MKPGVTVPPPAVWERLACTLRREILDRMVILGGRHLRAVLTGYQAHYNTARPSPVASPSASPTVKVTLPAPP